MNRVYTGELPDNERPVEAPTTGHGDYSSEHEDRWSAIRCHPDFMRYQREDRGHAPWSSIFWAALLIMAGVIFMASNLNMLPAGTEAIDWILLGAGGFMLIRALVQVILPDVAAPSMFHIIAGCVLIGIGLGNTFGLHLSFEQWWPVILIAVGLSALGSTLRR